MPRLGLAPHLAAIVITVGGALAPLGNGARAQVREVEMPPSEVAARGHYLMGLEHYRAGRFLEAATEFRQAYDLSPRPALLHNMFLAYRDAGDTANAAAALRAHLEAEPEADNAAMLRARLATLESQLEAERARDVGPASDAGRGVTAAATDASGDGPAVPPGALEPASDGGASVAPWIVVGSGAALLAGAAVTGALAWSQHDELESQCPDHRCPADFDADSRKSTGSALAIATDVLGGVGIAALGAGIVWAIVAATSGSSDEHAAVTCGPLACRVRF